MRKDDVEHLRERAAKEAWTGMSELKGVMKMSEEGAAAAMMVDDYARASPREGERTIEVWSEKVAAAEDARRRRARRRKTG